jgi:hypothetical protein
MEGEAERRMKPDEVRERESGVLAGAADGAKKRRTGSEADEAPREGGGVDDPRRPA